MVKLESASTKAKRVVKNTGIMYIRMLFMMFIGFYTSRVILKALGVDDFGIYNVVGGITAFLGFINNSMSVATIRYITYEQGKHSNIEKLHLVFCTAKYIHIFIAVIILLLAETLGLWYVLNVLVVPDNRFFATIVVYQFTIVSCVISILSVPYSALIAAHEKMSAFAYISIFEALMGLLIAFIIQKTSYDRLIVYGFLLMILHATVRLVYSIYCNKHFEEVKGVWAFDRLQFKEMVSFAFWISNGTLAVVAYTQGLNLLLNSFFGPVVNAARGIAVQVQSKIYNFCESFQTAVKPQITKSYSEEDFTYLHKLIINTSNYSFYLLFILSLPVYIHAPFILEKWLFEVPEYSVQFLRLTLIIGLLQSLKMPMNTSIHATGNIKKFQLFEATALLLILPTSYIALKKGCSPISVFVIQIFFFIIAQIIRGIIVCPAIKMKSSFYFRECLFRISSVILPPTILMYFIEKYICSLNEWLHFFISCIICCLLTSLSIYILGLKQLEKKQILSYIRNKIAK